jgi:hypothetical protein
MALEQAGRFGNEYKRDCKKIEYDGSLRGTRMALCAAVAIPEIE